MIDPFPGTEKRKGEKPRKVEVIEFDSILDCITAPKHHSESWDEATGRHHSNQSWLGVPDFKALEKAVKDGWPKAKEMMASLVLPEVPEAESIRRKTIWSEDGDVVDLDRLREGRLEDCWSSRKRRIRTAPRTINLLADIGTACFNSGNDLYYRGAAYLLLSDILEKAGYRVRIIAFECAENGWGCDINLIATQVIKEADMQIDVSALASVVCITGYKRLYWHRQYVDLTSRIHPGPFRDAAQLWVANQYPNEMTVFGSPDMRSTQEAVAFIQEALRQVEAG